MDDLKITPEPGFLDLSAAVVLVPSDLTAREEKAVGMLVEEVEKRSRLRWVVTSGNPPPPDTPVIAIAPGKAGAQSFPAQIGGYAPFDESLSREAEGYRIETRKAGKAGRVFVIGNDSRGVLFGVGRLLRELRMGEGRILLPEGFNLKTAPRYPLRGHQLGYRPKTNSYCAWDLGLWEQYFRDLAVFGTNAIELIPPRSDDAPDCPHFPLSQKEMMVGMSALADSYGLDVWVWYPAMDKDYGNPETVAFALAEWGEIFADLPRIDAVFVPGGDPGNTHPRHLMALLEKQTKELQRCHPEAQMWVSPQNFSRDWLEEFFRILKEDDPEWLSGTVFGPQMRVPIEEFRARVPSRFPIRNYPDITHSTRCQFPVPEWDTAYAMTEGREGINPRPLGQAAIFKYTQPHTFGFLTYSEGCNDDVNKIIWSGLGWNPETPLEEILDEYGRYFIGVDHAVPFREGVFALERNWKGPLLDNESVETTLQLFQSLENSAPPALLENWRFQQALYRAYYDAFIRDRLIFETKLEKEALQVLGEAGKKDALAALEKGEEVLHRPITEEQALHRRKRVFELAEALFHSIRMQLSVDRYQAIAVNRGANLDMIDFPLNNRLWLREKFREIRALSEEEERQKAIAAITHWKDPGEGGFYDDLGNPETEPHLVKNDQWENDPGFQESAADGFELIKKLKYPSMEPEEPMPLPLFWRRRAETRYDTPLRMRYGGLDPDARYRLRVVYPADLDKPIPKIRLLANDAIEIHPLIDRPIPFRPLEFEIPVRATADGSLTLTWTCEKGIGGNGRGCQVAEVWLKKSGKDAQRD